MNTNTDGVSAMSAELDDLRKDARAIFDALLFRAANNFYPQNEAECDKENKLIAAWARDALEEVAPDEFSEWRAIADAYKLGFEAGKRASSNHEITGHRVRWMG